MSARQALFALAMLGASLGAAAQGEGMRIQVGGKACEVILGEGEAARALAATLPLELRMEELNGNEKHGELPVPLPTSAFAPGTIRRGDLLLWGDRTLVLFYEGLASPYRYTLIGRLADPSCLGGIEGQRQITIRLTN